MCPYCLGWGSIFSQGSKIALMDASEKNARLSWVLASIEEVECPCTLSCIEVSAFPTWNWNGNSLLRYLLRNLKYRKHYGAFQSPPCIVMMSELILDLHHFIPNGTVFLYYFFILFFWVWPFWLHVCLSTMCMQCPQRLEEGAGYPETGTRDSCEPLCGFWVLHRSIKFL